MSVTSSAGDASHDSPERAGRVQQVVAECLQRRSSGEDLSDELVIASHRDLMPELGQALRKLRLVAQARRRAAEDAPTRPHAASATEPPLPFEGYEVVREIHRGGQGVVYEAIQKSTRQKVALKVLHGGPFVDARSRARLEREIQILGQLRHPNIVGIHDSGTTAGCPFYVMDYISGTALDAYCRENRLEIRARLQLFLKVCDAVTAAHLRGVIHRDLKPANIRVDAQGEPHVLDFGLAKVALAAVTDEPQPQLMSMSGQFIGSLPWASPEQAAGEADKTDLRTDVYALGVVLYQMLTERFPYEVVGRVPDVLEHILHAAPARPRALCPALDDELETIVLKCLEKPRERRYQSAGELARDIRHHLAGEPIEARRASMLYLLRKSLRRYRTVVTVAAACLVLVSGLALTMAHLYRRAEREARNAERVAGFLDRIFATVDPEMARGRELDFLRTAIDDAARDLGAARLEPETEARLQRSLGRLYLNLGLYGAAEAHLRRALELSGAAGAARAETLLAFGGALKEQGRHDEALSAYHEALALYTALHGADSLTVAETLNALGQAHFDRREYAQAQPYLETALALRERLGAADRERANSLANLGSLLREQAQLAKAEPLLVRALELRRRVLGAEHPHTLVSLNKLALLRRAQGRHTEARALFEEYLDLGRKVLGAAHAHVGVALNNLGLTLYDEGDFASAAAHFAQAVDVYRQSRGPTHPQVAGALVNWAGALERQGDFAAAWLRCEEALTLLPHDDPRRAQALFLAGQLHWDQGDAAGALPALRTSYAINREKLGISHPGTRRVEALLIECLSAADQLQEAGDLLEDCYAELERTAGAADPQTSAALERLIAFHEDNRQFADAAHWRALLSTQSQPAPSPPPDDESGQ